MRRRSSRGIQGAKNTIPDPRPEDSQQQATNNASGRESLSLIPSLRCRNKW